MSQEKANIFLDKINLRIDQGEFDKSFNIPFASRKLLKSNIKSKMDKKVETNSTPIFSEDNIEECVKEVRETAASTAEVFLKIGILIKDGDGYKVSEKWNKVLNPK